MMKPDSDIQALLSQIDRTQVMSLLDKRFTRSGQLFASDLPSKDAAAAIYAFLIRYVVVIPELLLSLEELARVHKIDPLIDPYLQLATNYLNAACKEFDQDKPPDALHQYLTLLQGAYIFHRMIEELDDRIENFIGVPLTHNDTMNANLIAHHIIGDAFANRLDDIVTSLFQQSTITKSLIEAQLKRHQVEQYRQSGKALSGESVRCFAAENNLRMLTV